MLECLSTVISLDETDHIRRPLALIFQPSYTVGCLETQSRFNRSVHQFLLDELEGGERLFELVSFEGVGASGFDAVFERAYDAPGDAVSVSE